MRGTIVNSGKINGKDYVGILSRAASKPGAIVAARIRAAKVIPLREQEIGEVRNLSNMRLLDQWEVEVIDRKDLDNVGR